jgi:hypothetical protein
VQQKQVVVILALVLGMDPFFHEEEQQEQVEPSGSTAVPWRNVHLHAMFLG